MPGRSAVLGKLWRRRHPVAVAIFLAYFSLLLAPCAMAMGSPGEPLPAGCHGQMAGGADDDCLDQPIAECGNGVWHSEKRESPIAKADVAPIAASPAVPEIAVRPRFPGRPPGDSPPLRGQPRTHLRYCVFLN